jgi:hypothetical protein
MTTSTAPNTKARSTGRATGTRRGAGRGENRGAGKPRVIAVPPSVSSLGEEAVELAESAGLKLDPWQAKTLEHALGQREDGKWAAFEVGICAPRQNGKDAILEARELAGLFLIGERLIVHSAHQFDTSLEAFRRLLWLIEDTPELEKQVKRVSRSHGEEGIELKSGSRIRFRTRTKGGGRGFTCDLLILNEAMILPEFGYGALLPTLSARPNPQVLYTGSAVDQEIHDDGIVFARVRERGLEGKDPSLVYVEWSLDAERPDELEDAVLNDPKAWAQANPAFGVRISEEHIANEQRAMDARTFAVERLGVGDWPDTSGTPHVIDMEQWASLRDFDSKPLDPVCFAFDVAPDRSRSAIAVAGYREDGVPHIEVIDRAPGTGWVVNRLKQLIDKHECIEPRCDARGPAASLIPNLEGLDIAVNTVDGHEMAQACGRFFDAVDQGELRHLGTSETTSALKGAAQRPLGDSWAWSRKNSSVDISPLVALTLALSGLLTQPVVSVGFEWW